MKRYVEHRLMRRTASTDNTPPLTRAQLTEAKKKIDEAYYKRFPKQTRR